MKPCYLEIEQADTDTTKLDRYWQCFSSLFGWPVYISVTFVGIFFEVSYVARCVGYISTPYAEYLLVNRWMMLREN